MSRIAALGDSTPVFWSRFPTGARIMGLGTFKDKTPGHPIEPIALETLGRADAAQGVGATRKAGVERSLRALKRFNEAPATLPGGEEDL
jgi:hypothetical protein